MLFARAVLVCQTLVVYGAEQPDRWEPINSDHEYFATKTILVDPDGKGTGQQSEFIQMYYRNSKKAESDVPDQIMSVRKAGIYATARWDYENMKTEFYILKQI